MPTNSLSSIIDSIGHIIITLGRTLSEETSVWDKIFTIIGSLPPPLQEEINYYLLEEIWYFADHFYPKDLVEEQFSIFGSILSKVDTAIMSIDNGTTANIPPNLFELIQWYDNFGPRTLGVLLEALEKESLHRFLVDNSLPTILSNSENFFCGPSSLSRFSMYFNDTQLHVIQMALCNISWGNISLEFEEYFFANSTASKLDFFRISEIANRITHEFILPEWSKLLNEVNPYYERFLRYTLKDL